MAQLPTLCEVNYNVGETIFEEIVPYRVRSSRDLTLRSGRETSLSYYDTYNVRAEHSLLVGS